MNQATSARENTIIAGEKEQIALAWSSLVLDKTTGKIDNIDEDDFEAELNNSGNNTQVDYVDNDVNKDFSVTFIDTTHEYIVDKNGNITLRGTKIIENETEVNIELTEMIYVTLYNDGTLAFSNNNTTDSSKTVTKIYTIAKNDIFNSIEDNIPWKDERLQIKFVDFVNKIVPLYMDWWFWKCENLQEIKNLNNLYTNYTISMFGTFCDCYKLSEINLNNLNTKNVTSMGYMFSGCNTLNSIDLTGFDTRNVTDMQRMFFGCNKLTTIKLGTNWNTSNVINMNRLCSDCYSLNENGIDLTKFNTSKVTDMAYMFSGCINFANLYLTNFDTSNVTDMTCMFGMPAYGTSQYGKTKLETVTLGNKWDTSKVESMKWMFSECVKIKKVYASIEFLTNNVTESNDMFWRM